VAKIDRVARAVIADDGTRAPYDRLLLATGSNPFVLPIPGVDLDGVLTYRDIRDTEGMIAAASRYRSAVVIGGGLLGLEAANGLKLRGMQVTVVHLMPWLMERQLDQAAARLLQKNLERRASNSGSSADREARRRSARHRGAADDGRGASRGPGRDGGRHPAEHEARGGSGPSLRARDRRERHDANLRSARLCRSASA
jgi:NAD(P)H-nitrite reductase large subunit